MIHMQVIYYTFAVFIPYLGYPVLKILKGKVNILDTRKLHFNSLLRLLTAHLRD